MLTDPEKININHLSNDIYKANKEKGFWPEDNKRNIGEMLMLVVSELGEAIEAHRKGRMCRVDIADCENIEYTDEYGEHDVQNIIYTFDIDFFKENVKDTFEDEIADAFIRLFDMCGGLNIDIYKHIMFKLQYNKTREKLHGKQY